MPLSMPQCDEHIRSEHWYAHREKDMPRPQQQRAYYHCKNRVSPLKPAEKYLEERRVKRIERMPAEVTVKRAQTFANHRTIGQRFREQAEQWDRETAHLSSPPQRFQHPSYVAILGMASDHRDEVINLMLRDMQQNRREWFWALSYLTHENPIDRRDSGRLDKMIRAWVDWGKQRGRL